MLAPASGPLSLEEICNQVSYLQYAIGDSVDNPTVADVQTAIKIMETMDEEHGAFWVGTDEEDVVLEVNLGLTLTMIEDGGEEHNASCKDWEQVLEMYSLLLSGDYSRLKYEFAKLPKWERG
jgi:hypothetical protein